MESSSEILTFFPTGFINDFLAWKGFVAMSRLTFMVYLVHPWLIWLYMGNLRRTVDTSHYTGVSN